VERLAAQIGPAIENSRLYEKSKQIENELRQSDERARALLESAPQGIIATNESGEIVQVNDAVLEIFGYSREELLSQSVDILLPEAFRSGHAAQRKSYVADPQVRPMGAGRELFGLRRDGSSVPLEIGLSFVATESGTIALAFITDISQRKQAEEAERQWAEETEVMAEIGRGISSSLNIDEVYDHLAEAIRRIIPFDQASLTMVDWEAGTVSPSWVTGTDVPGRRYGGVISLDGTLAQRVVSSQSLVVVAVENENELLTTFPGLIPHFRAGMRSFISAPLVHRGNVIGVLQLTSTERGEYSQRQKDILARVGQQIAGALANSQLYAERVDAERAMRASEQKYRTLVNESPDIIFVSRVDNFRFTEVNDRACEIYGYSREEFLTMEIFDIEVEAPAKEQVRSLYDDTPAGQVFELYGTNKRKDGTTFPVHVRFSKLDDDFAIANVRDITDQRAAEETQSRLAESTAALAEIGRTVSASLDINDVYNRLGEVIAQLIPYDHLSMSLINVEKGIASPQWLLGARSPGRDPGVELPLAGTLAGEAVRMRSPVLIEIDSEAELGRRFPLATPAFHAGMRSFIVVPLIDHDVVIGALQIRSSEKGVYSQRHLDLAERISNQIAGAIANAQLYVEHQRLAEENAVMAEIGRTISSSLNIGDVLQMLGEQIKKLIPFDRFSLNLVDYEIQTTSPMWSMGTPIPGRGTSDQIPISGSLSGEVVLTGSPVMVDVETEAEVESRFPLLIPAFEAGLRSFLSVPLTHRSHIIGVMQLRTKEHGVYSQRHLELAERISNQIAGAIANSQLYVEHQRLAEENTVMAEIGRIVGSSLDSSGVYERPYEEMRKLVPFDRISTSLADLERGTLTNNYVLGTDIAERRAGRVFPIANTFAGSSIVSGSNHVCHPADEDDLTGPQNTLRYAFRTGLRSMLTVRLVSSGTTVGVLHLQSVKPNAYTSEVVEIVERIAALIAPSLENGRLYDEQNKSLKEKEVLLQEINHRVKNNLQIISSLLNLQSRDIKDEQVLRAFQTGQDRIGAMAMVHEKLYQSEDLARIDFGDYIRSLAANLISSYGLGSRDIDLKIDVENILLGVDTAIPCGVIVNELVANSLKHAFPGDRSGEIDVSFHEVDGQYTMVFRDNGVGMSEDLDFNRPSSLGLTIVNALTGQLRGAIVLGRNGGGCEVSITFPVPSTNGNKH
jgi:PAS domain S-box-containing protein